MTDPRWNKLLEDVITGIIEDFAEFNYEYGEDIYVTNADKLSKMIIAQVDIRDYSIKLTGGVFPKNDEEFFAIQAKVKKKFG